MTKKITIQVGKNRLPIRGVALRKKMAKKIIIQVRKNGNTTLS